ncbi:hypothetical protein OGAPHI_000012 [Ogataea philodendri]|uniref:Zn(2)-C6 fungal-type domain-containing protein n=1 Tax=Ogataea philodendri TaxID=1378263 RepID=A0A9P8TB65_9ASCO|nr:uncharacterized protein OGAPHI_000012 [Ogataea philodendri]KAH3671826.1 hypothetical protein OGAPHI_000012 [Ogataea philodendri]
MSNQDPPLDKVGELDPGSGSGPGSGYEYSNWREHNEFNYFTDNNMHLDLGSQQTFVNSGQSNMMSPVNVGSVITPASPAEYVMHLQQYQNILMEHGTKSDNNNTPIAHGSNPSSVPSVPSVQSVQSVPGAPHTSGPPQANGNNQFVSFMPSFMNPQALMNQYPNAMPGPFPMQPVPIGYPMPAKNEPPQPRTKVKPCDHCRRRKIRCVMVPESNMCKMCQNKGIKCTFIDGNAAGTKRSFSSPETESKRMKFEEANIIPPPDVPLRETLPIKDYSTMQGHSLLKKTLSLQYPRSSFYVGPTSLYDTIFLEKVTLDKVDQFELSKKNSIRKVASNVQFTLRDDFSEDLLERSDWDSDSVERYVAPHGQELIDLYFRTVHPSFPILHKKVVLEKYSRTHREFSAPLLAAVYCLAIQWWDYDAHLSQFPKPNVVALLKFALKTFSDVIQRPKLSSVQAGLLLLQCRDGGSKDNNWLLCSQVVALAEELGLGLDCASWRLPRWERGLRKRLAWAVYIQDKWSSLVESRPSHIIEGKNWLVRMVGPEDFPDKGDADQLKEGSADNENGEALFRQLISLSEILSEILDTFYTMASMQNVNSIEEILKLAKPLQLKLRNWYHSLPETLQMNTPKPRKFNSNGYLQLAYFASEITLHRRIISCLHTQKASCPPELVRVCRTAAQARLTASIEFARNLKPEHIQSFWQSAATNNFALIGIFATILYVTSDTDEEANGYRQQLFDYRWILKVNSKSFDIAGEALAKIDGMLKNLPGLLSEYEDTSAALPVNTEVEGETPSETSHSERSERVTEPGDK